MAGHNYRELLVWQKSMVLVTDVYRILANFPKEEMYGLAGQLRRAVVSIPSNIAEGHGRSSAKEFMHHLSFAHGSLMEVETHLQIAVNLGYLKEDILNSLFEKTSEIGRLINGLCRSLKNKNL
jgi:four helix bundle protein